MKPKPYVNSDDTELQSKIQLKDYLYSDEYNIYTVTDGKFLLPEKLNNYTIFDFTGNNGDECLKRSARKVFQFDIDITTLDAFPDERIRKFRKFSLKKMIKNSSCQRDFVGTFGLSDYVLCIIDEQSIDYDAFFEFITKITREICIICSVIGNILFEINNYMYNYGFNFVSVVYEKRFIKSNKIYYILDKKKLLSSRGIESYKGNSLIYRKISKFFQYKIPYHLWVKINSIFCEKEISKHYCKTYFFEKKYIREFADYEQWQKIKNLYEKIKHIPYIQECDFSFYKKIISVEYSNNLLESNFSDDNKKIMKRQIIALLSMLNKSGVAHRDFHLGNLFFNNNKIILIDLEFLEKDSQPLLSCYDVTGKGLDSPLKSGNMHLFIEHPNSVSKFLDINLEDLMTENLA